MALVDVGPRRRVVSDDLSGPDDAPVLVLLGPLGTTSAVWGPQMQMFTSWFRVLSVAHPGTANRPAKAQRKAPARSKGSEEGF